MTREWTKQATWFLLRVVTALLFFQAGSLKLFGWYGGIFAAHGAGAWSVDGWLARRRTL